MSYRESGRKLWTYFIKRGLGCKSKVKESSCSEDIHSARKQIAKANGSIAIKIPIAFVLYNNTLIGTGFTGYRIQG